MDVAGAARLPGGPTAAPTPAHEFATGPNVCITAPAESSFTGRLSSDGLFTDLAIGAGSGTGVYLTLPRRGLDFLIGELREVLSGAVNLGGIDPVLPLGPRTLTARHRPHRTAHHRPRHGRTVGPSPDAPGGSAAPGWDGS